MQSIAEDFKYLKLAHAEPGWDAGCMGLGKVIKNPILHHLGQLSDQGKRPAHANASHGHSGEEHAWPTGPITSEGLGNHMLARLHGQKATHLLDQFHKLSIPLSRAKHVLARIGGHRSFAYTYMHATMQSAQNCWAVNLRIYCKLAIANLLLLLMSQRKSDPEGYFCLFLIHAWRP